MLFLLALLASTYARPEQLVETEWVVAHAADANVRVVDMRQAGYAEGHVPGAVQLSPVAIRDAKAPPTFLPNSRLLPVHGRPHQAHSFRRRRPHGRAWVHLARTSAEPGSGRSYLDRPY